MRTRTWLLALSALAVPAATLVACSDDGGGSGGTGGGKSTTSSTTTSVTTTVGSTTTASSSSTTSAGGYGADNCPGGSEVDLTVDQTAGDHQVTIQGSTTNATDNLTDFCAPGVAAPDFVYKIHTTQECTFTATLAETGFDGLLSLRSTCDVRTGDSVCYNQATSGETMRIDLPAGDHWLVVDGATAGAKGDYKLTLDCADPECGDGIVGAEEQCDQGTTPPPGCGAPGSGTPAGATACQYISTPAADTCPGTAITVNPGPAQLFPSPPPPYNNFGLNDDYQPVIDANTCPFIAPVVANGDKGPDQVFDLVPSANGNLSVTIGTTADGVTNACTIAGNPGCWNSGLFIREGDCVTGAQIACEIEGHNNTGIYSVTVPNAVAGTHYHVFVKSNDPAFSDATYATGPYYLKIQLQ